MPKFATKAADNMFCQARYEAAKFNERLSSREAQSHQSIAWDKRLLHKG